jgi:hypothetical protein
LLNDTFAAVTDVKFTLRVCVNVVAFTSAESVFASAIVEVVLIVAAPDAFVVLVLGVNVLPVPVDDMLAVRLESVLPNWSFAVIVPTILSVLSATAEVLSTVNVEADALITPATWESDPKFVTLFVMPVIVAFPALREFLVMLPLAGKLLPLVARTWMPLILIVSFLLPVPSVVKIIVIVDEETEMLIEDISALLENVPELDTLPTPGLNCHPEGAVRMSSAFVWLAAKSAFVPSAIMIGPSDVYAGDAALAALSAERALPPVAAVIVTAAKAFVAKRPSAMKKTSVKANDLCSPMLSPPISA